MFESVKQIRGDAFSIALVFNYATGNFDSLCITNSSLTAIKNTHAISNSYLHVIDPTTNLRIN